ncbi:aminotransferase class I/II-fold pyridoxal phosphate-dependent enzyme [Salinarimonas rosea]|uniref:aminotransferase class I/II-fold pyridoxal phosphate-dependent enzyme n=1 Tax=Salinarimonas rosea TaxID=552063 RepID=UPI000416D247|nr:aminotransferase class I/II-fold pyridoxal phosphate-dependent enzyme [Salinarimonas rosea]
MPALAELSTDDLRALAAEVARDIEAFRAKGLALDMTRGKPAPEQLDLANAMLALPGNGDYHTQAGEDARNYGGLQGIAEARRLFAGMVGAPPEQVVIGENASLAMMHDCLVWALLHGVPGGAGPWSREPDGIAFLCPVPGYDRHFAITEGYGVRMIPVPLTGEGPDVDAVARAVEDPSVKGMWCVPKYSNPTGETYAPGVVEALARMRTAAPDFRLFWDNAYAVHDLVAEGDALANVLDACAAAGNPDRAFVFASTSKVTFAGAGLSFFGSSPANVAWYLAKASLRTIGPNKLNQLRHVRFFGDEAGLSAHMDRHRALLAPKFAAVEDALQARLAGTGAAHWARPRGGYFVSVDVRPGTARQVVATAKALGIAMTPAGSTWPGGTDPRDENLRIAPSFPSLADVRAAAEGVALAILAAAVEAEQQARGEGTASA